MEIMEMKELIMMLIPVIVVQLGLIIYAIIQLFKHGVRNLNKVAWLIIILFINLFGPILFLIFGKGDEDNA